MTATATKVCPQCGKEFARRSGEIPSEFARRAHCSVTCGAKTAYQKSCRRGPNRPPTAKRTGPPPPVVGAREDMHWRMEGACGDEDLDLFFPPGSGTPSHAQIDEAKAVCARCPVRVRCLAWALQHGERGIWGGTSEAERKALRNDVRT